MLQQTRVYPSGRYFAPGYATTSTAATATGTGNLNCYIDRIHEPLTITGIGLRVTTAASGGNVVVSLYAANASTLAPTGAPLFNSAPLSTSATGFITDTTVNYAITAPGWYWWCSQIDSVGGTAFFSAIAANGLQGSVIGGTTLSAPIMAGMRKAQTYSTTGPTLTGDFTADGFADNSSSTTPTIVWKK